jgi:hypothetical protein
MPLSSPHRTSFQHLPSHPAPRSRIQPESRLPLSLYRLSLPIAVRRHLFIINIHLNSCPFINDSHHLSHSFIRLPCRHLSLIVHRAYHHLSNVQLTSIHRCAYRLHHTRNYTYSLITECAYPIINSRFTSWWVLCSSSGLISTH